MPTRSHQLLLAVSLKLSVRKPARIQDAIIRRRASHGGTLCVTGDVRKRLDNLNRNVRSKFIRDLLRTIRNLGG